MGKQFLVQTQARCASSHWKNFATIDPANLSPQNKGMNLVNGEWTGVEKYFELVDPLTGKPMISIPETFDFFVELIQRCVPKSYAQTAGEVRVTRAFFENFCGDQVRFLAEASRNPGDHAGQFATGYRWPYGGVGVITPFNFPIEIPVLQMMGALFMGNKPVVKPDTRTSFPLEQWIRMLHYCGLPRGDLDFLHCEGPQMEYILKKGDARTTLFTGSSRVGEHLVKKLDGKVKLEDGGYDWKILAQTFHALSRKSTTLLGKVTMMLMAMRDRNALLNRLCSFTKTGRKLTSTRRWLPRPRREV